MRWELAGKGTVGTEEPRQIVSEREFKLVTFADLDDGTEASEIVAIKLDLTVLDIGRAVNAGGDVSLACDTASQELTDLYEDLFVPGTCDLRTDVGGDAGEFVFRVVVVHDANRLACDVLENRAVIRTALELLSDSFADCLLVMADVDLSQRAYYKSIGFAQTEGAWLHHNSGLRWGGRGD